MGQIEQVHDLRASKRKLELPKSVENTTPLRSKRCRNEQWEKTSENEKSAKTGFQSRRTP